MNMGYQKTKNWIEYYSWVATEILINIITCFNLIVLKHNFVPQELQEYYIFSLYFSSVWAQVRYYSIKENYKREENIFSLIFHDFIL